MTLLEAREITVRFGGLLAVNEVSLAVPEGGIAGLIGPNGAGKTTTFNVLSGFQQPTAGQVLFEGRNVTSMPASARARLGFGRTFQKLELFGRMTVFDNLLVAAEAGNSRLDIVSDLLSLPRRHNEERRCAAIAREMADRLGLTEWLPRRAADVPVGVARILELARALCSAPKLLLLDEPSSGLDSDETKAFGDLLKRVNSEMGIALLLVEHDMDLVMEVCKQLTVLDFGARIAEGAPADVVRDPRVRAAYLGEEGDEAAAPTA